MRVSIVLMTSVRFRDSPLTKVPHQTQPDFLTRQPKHPHTSDIIYLPISASHITDANIDATCNRTLYGSNWVVCVGKSISTFYN
jgi:hypothetical protein